MMLNGYKWIQYFCQINLGLDFGLNWPLLIWILLIQSWIPFVLHLRCWTGDSPIMLDSCADWIVKPVVHPYPWVFNLEFQPGNPVEIQEPNSWDVTKTSLSLQLVFFLAMSFHFCPWYSYHVIISSGAVSKELALAPPQPHDFHVISTRMDLERSWTDWAPNMLPQLQLCQLCAGIFGRLDLPSKNHTPVMASRLVSACQCYHFRESQCCHVVSLNETWLESPQSPPAGKTPWNSSRSWGPNPRIPLRSKLATCNEFPNSGAKSMTRSKRETHHRLDDWYVHWWWFLTIQWWF